MTAVRQVSFVLIFALLAAACYLRLGPVLLAGLYAYMILDLTDRSLGSVLPHAVARWLAVVVFLITAVALTWMFVAFVQLAVARMPEIVGAALPTVDQLAAGYGVELPFENLHELRVLLIQSIKVNARSITATSGFLTHGAFRILIGVLVANAYFLSQRPADQKPSLFTSLRDEMGQRIHLFMDSYERVLGAQVVLSLINTLITTIFIAAAGIPYLPFLSLACFILGVIPVVGNIASNAVIIGAALTQSPQLGLTAFLFLVLSHRAQHLLGVQVLGARLEAPMWLTLLGVIVGEVLMGVPGMILAPAVIHYAREELSRLPASSQARR